MNALGRTFIALHNWFFRVTGGRVGGSFGGRNKVLLLTTTGNKSGQLRTVPVMAYPEDGTYHVVASNNGQATHPAWYLNLVKTPQVHVELPGDSFDAVAEELAGEEREALFTRLQAAMPQFSGYEGKVAGRRVIPVIRLKRV